MVAAQRAAGLRGHLPAARRPLRRARGGGRELRGADARRHQPGAEVRVHRQRAATHHLHALAVRHACAREAALAQNIMRAAPQAARPARTSNESSYVCTRARCRPPWMGTPPQARHRCGRAPTSAYSAARARTACPRETGADRLARDHRGAQGVSTRYLLSFKINQQHCETLALPTHADHGQKERCKNKGVCSALCSRPAHHLSRAHHTVEGIPTITSGRMLWAQGSG